MTSRMEESSRPSETDPGTSLLSPVIYGFVLSYSRVLPLGMAEESDRNLWDVFGVPNSSDLPSAQGIDQPSCANGAQEHDLENVHSLNPPGTSLPLKAAAGQKLVSIAAVSCTGDIPDESHRNGGEWIELSERHFFDSIAMEKSTNGNNGTSEHREEICNGTSTILVSNGKTTSEEASPSNNAEANGTEREPETAVNLENNDRTEASDVRQERSIFEHINSNFLPLLESTKHDQTNGVLNGEGNVSGDSCIVESAVSPNATCLPPKESQQNSGEPCGNRETDSNLFERVIVTASAADTSSQGQTSENANPGFPFSEKLRRLTAWNKDNGSTMSNTVQPLRTGYDAVSAGCSFQHLAPLQLPPATPNTMATRFVNGQHQSLGIQVNKPTETSEVDANLVFEPASPLGYVNPTSNYVVRIQNGIPETVPRTVNTLTVSGGTGQTGSTVVINNPAIKANLRRLAPNTQFIRLKRVVIDPRGNLKERANGENVPTSMSTAQIVGPFIAPNPGPLNSYVTAVSPAQAFRSNGMGSAPFSHIQPAPSTLQGHSSNSRFQMVLPVLTPAGIVQPPAVNPLVMQSPAVVPINRTNLSGIIPSDLSCGERLLPSPELKERRFRPVSPPKRELPSDKPRRTSDARTNSGIQGSSNAVRSSIRSLRTFLSNKVSSSDRRGSVEAELADQSYECALRESNSPDRERFLRCESSPVAVRLQSDSTCGSDSEKLIGYQSTPAALHEGERDRSDLSSISEEKIDDKSTTAVLSKGERNHLSTITEEKIDDQSTPAALSECERKCYDLSTITEEKIDDHSTPAALSEGECKRNDLSTIAEEKIDDQSTPATLSEAKRECNDIQMITEETSDVKLPDSPRTKDIEDADRASRKKQGNAMVRRLEPRLPSPVREHNSVGDLYRDPSQLTREERALQRAMMQFSVMEMKAKTDAPRTKHSIKRRLRKRSKLPAQTTVNKTHSGPKTWLKRIKRKRLFFSQRRRIAVKPEDPENNSSVKSTKPQQTPIIRRKRKLLPSADVKDGQPRIKRKCMETGKRDAIVPPADVQQTKATPLNHKSADIKPTKARRKSSEAFTQIQPKHEVVSEPTSGKGPQEVTSGKRPLHFALSSSDMKRRGVKRARVEIEPLHFETKEELQTTIEETAKVDRSHRVKTYMLVTSYQGFRDFKPVVLQSRTRRKSKPADEETPTTTEPPHEFPLLVVESVHSKPVKERVIAQNEEVQQLVENCLKARGKWHGNDAPGEEDANEDETLQDLRKLNVNRNTGETILHKAARLGYHETVRHHIHQGVDPNAKDNAGWTPLHEACSRGKVDVVKVLAKYGSDVNACSNDGIRPIHDAAEGGHVNVLRVLLSYGADPLLATYSGNTALRCAKETRTMAFLEGYLEDLGIRSSVPSVTEGEGCWEFASSCSLIDDTTEHTGGIFDGIPDGDSIGDGEFEMCDRPHLPTYNLPVMASEELMCGRRNYVLMSDLLDHLRMSRAVLLKRCRRLDIREMPWSQFLAEIADRPLCVAPKFSPPDSSTQEGIAELVPLNYSVRKLLNIRVECVNLT